MLIYLAGLAASQGARKSQEDAAALWPGPAMALPAFEHDAPEEGRLVAVLADGMGGHVGGALASRTVCAQFLTTFASQPAAVTERLEAAMWASNRAISQIVAANRSLDGMGSTLVGATFGPEGLEWVSVGDSPLYLWRSSEVALVNEDHSLAPLLDQLAAAGKITESEALADPRRHMLRSAITGSEIELIDLPVRPLELLPGDCVIIASDGIHTLDAGEISRIVAAYRADGADAIAAALVRAVENLRDPHQDNVTVIAVEVRES
jgi:serine/threonine protein phosphatase PrpC